MPNGVNAPEFKRFCLALRSKKKTTLSGLLFVSLLSGHPWGADTAELTPPIILIIVALPHTSLEKH